MRTGQSWGVPGWGAGLEVGCLQRPGAAWALVCSSASLLLFVGFVSLGKGARTQALLERVMAASCLSVDVPVTILALVALP